MALGAQGKIEHAKPAQIGAAAHIPALPPRTLWFVGVASAALLSGYLVVLASQQQVDFEVYRMGGQHVFGSGLYSSHVTAVGRHYLFTYPPLAAVLFWPVSHLSTYVGNLLWDAINVVALTILIALSIAAARGRTLVRSDWRTALILLLPFGVLLYPLRVDLALGQINLLLLVMIVADLVVGVSWRGTSMPKGVLVGLAAAMKLTPLIFFPYLLATRQWRAARNMAITFLVFTGILFVARPEESWLYFTKDAFDVKRVGTSSGVVNQTLRAALLRGHLLPSHAVLALITVLFACGGIALAARAHRTSSALLGVLLCAATGLMVSPISWLHHYVWIVPVLVWLVAGVDRPAAGTLWAAVAAVTFMVVPPGTPGDANVGWYVRENSYVIATLAFLTLTGAMLWARGRAREPRLPDVPSLQSVR